MKKGKKENKIELGKYLILGAILLAVLFLVLNLTGYIPLNQSGKPYSTSVPYSSSAPYSTSAPYRTSVSCTPVGKACTSNAACNCGLFCRYNPVAKTSQCTQKPWWAFFIGVR
jgi:hypothetical protein